MAVLTRIEKQNQFLVFHLADGTSVTYDLELGITIGKKGNPVRGLNSQLRGIYLEEVKDLFDDQGFYKYLSYLQTAKTYDSRTLSGVLSRVAEFPHLEGYVRLGIHAQTNIAIPVSKVPRSMLNWIRGLGTAAPMMTTDLIRQWKANEPEVQAILTVRDALNYRMIDKIILDLIRERGYMRSDYGNYAHLLEKYRYDPVTLAKYVCATSNYEGLMVYEVVQNLADYARMQYTLSNGEHSFEKYPKNLLTVHRIAQRNIGRMNKTFDEEAFAATYDPTMETRIGDYVFICPQRSSEIKNEAVQQLHCVAAYIDHVIEGNCHIIFMRDRKTPHKSFITLEVVGNQVVQAKGFRDRDVTADEAMIISKYSAYLDGRKVVGKHDAA